MEGVSAQEGPGAAFSRQTLSDATAEWPQRIPLVSENQPGIGGSVPLEPATGLYSECSKRLVYCSHTTRLTSSAATV